MLGDIFMYKSCLYTHSPLRKRQNSNVYIISDNECSKSCLGCKLFAFLRLKCNYFWFLSNSIVRKCHKSSRNQLLYISFIYQSKKSFKTFYRLGIDSNINCYSRVFLSICSINVNILFIVLM